MNLGHPFAYRDMLRTNFLTDLAANAQIGLGILIKEMLVGIP